MWQSNIHQKTGGIKGDSLYIRLALVYVSTTCLHYKNESTSVQTRFSFWHEQEFQFSKSLIPKLLNTLIFVCGSLLYIKYHEITVSLKCGCL